MANLPDHQWKNTTGLDLFENAKHLAMTSQKGQLELFFLRGRMNEATGETKDAYKKVIDDVCWKLTQELYVFEKSMIGWITDFQYPENAPSVPIDPFKTANLGATGCAVEVPDTRGANGPSGTNEESFKYM